MRNKKKIFITLAALLAALLVFGACAREGEEGVGVGGAEGANQPTGAMFESIAYLAERYPTNTPQGSGIGGILNFALVTPSNFAGMFNPAFSITADDGTINDFMFTGLLHLNAENMYSDQGPAWFEFDRDLATFTIHFHDDTRMYWHDGVEVTMYDLEFAVLMIAHPDTLSDRFGPALNTSTIVGVDAFRAGETDYISGIRVFNNGRSLEYTFESIDPSILFGGVWAQPLPKHIFSEIPWANHRDHPASRYQVIGNGPFMLTHVVPGEAVQLVANPNFWLGAPNLDGINLAVIEPSLIGEAMLIGEFDLARFPVDFLTYYEDRLTNAMVMSNLYRRFDFMGFRFGFFDHDTQTITPNPDTYINCIYLRRALAFARDDMTTSNYLFNGLRFPIATTLIPWQGDFIRDDMEGFSRFDLDLANQILDDAGYEWRAGEQFRRHNVTGEFFTLNWMIADNPANRVIVEHHIQNWAEVGLDVALWQGNLVDFNVRVETLRNDLDEGTVHIYDAAWLKGSNPNPRALWGATTHNDTRYQSPRLDAIMDQIESEYAWDADMLRQFYFEWQLAVYEEVPWVPVTTAVDLWVANNRVLNFSLLSLDGIRSVSWGATHLWDLTSASPYSN